MGKKSIIMDPLKCGGCGCDKFTLSNERPADGGRDHIGRIHVTCLGCKSVSVISVSAPAITIDWSDPPGDPLRARAIEASAYAPPARAQTSSNGSTASPRRSRPAASAVRARLDKQKPPAAAGTEET